MQQKNNFRGDAYLLICTTYGYSSIPQSARYFRSITVARFGLKHLPSQPSTCTHSDVKAIGDGDIGDLDGIDDCLRWDTHPDNL